MSPSSRSRLHIRQRGVLVASGGLGLALVVGLVLKLTGLAQLNFAEWLFCCAATLVVQTALWLVPRLELDRQLGWDPHYIYLPSLGVGLLFTLYVYLVPEGRFLVLMGWLATLLFLAGLASFKPVLLLGSAMSLGYLAVIFILSATDEALQLPLELGLGCVFFAINVYAAFVLDSLRYTAQAARTHAIWQSTADAIVTVADDGAIQTFNPSAERSFGYRAAEVVGRDVGLLFEPSEVDPQRLPWKPLPSSEVTDSDGELVTAARRKDGTVFSVALRVSEMLHGGDRMSVCTVQDITERRRTEEALQFQNALLATQQETSPDGILVVDTLGRMISFNRRFVEMWGLGSDVLESRSDERAQQYVIDQLVSPDEFLARINHLYQHPEEVSRDEIRLTDGRTFERHSAPMLGADGTHYGRIWHFRDVSDQRRAEEALRRNEEEFRALVEQQGEGIGAVDGHECFTFANRAAEKLFGVPEGGLLGHCLSDFMDERTFSRIQAETERRRAGKTSIYELEITRPSGEKRTLAVTASPRVNENGDLVSTLGVFRDITKRTRAEQALRASRERLQKLHAVARRLMACSAEEYVYKLTVDGAQDIVEFSVCTLSIAEDGDLRLKARMPPGTECGALLKLAESTRKAARTLVFGSRDELSGGTLGSQQLESGVSFPIGDLGVFQVFSASPNAFDRDDVRLLEVLLGYIAEGLKRVRLQSQLEDQAVRDPLTQVYNRRFLEQALQRETTRARRSKRSIGFVMIDIDRFKEINDRFGHGMGDEVLRGVASVLQGVVRTTDIVIRLGGDEFLILMPEAEHGAQQLEKRITESLARWNEQAGQLDFLLTVSMGHASWKPGSEETVEAVLARADLRMYQRKAQIRDLPLSPGGARSAGEDAEA